MYTNVVHKNIDKKDIGGGGRIRTSYLASVHGSKHDIVFLGWQYQIDWSFKEEKERYKGVLE